MVLGEAIGPGIWVGQKWFQVHSFAWVRMGEVGRRWELQAVQSGCRLKAEGKGP